MCNRYVVTVPSCYGVRLARETALRECVMNSALYLDFLKTHRDDEVLDEFIQRMDDFIRDRSVRIIDEKIHGRIDGDRYKTEVTFVVTWN